VAGAFRYAGRVDPSSKFGPSTKRVDLLYLNWYKTAMPAKRGLDWAGSSNDDIRGFPKEVRGQLAYAFFLAQEGKKHPDAKPLRGFGDTSVLEVVVDHDGDTFRGVYTTRFPGPVWVLHCFKKKSKRGVQTPKNDIDLIKVRLKELERHHRR
jgi:phage-related protein